MGDVIRIGKWFPTTVQFDGHDLDIKVRRMDLDTFEQFSERFHEITERKAPDYAGMTPEEEKVARAARKVEDAQAREWIKQVLTEFVVVKAGQLVAEDEKGEDVVVTTGAQLAEFYGGQIDAIAGVLTAIFIENRLTSEQKKILKSRLASTPSSPEPTTTTPGSAPAPTATDAEPKASAPDAAAMDPSATTCGTTAPSL